MDLFRKSAGCRYLDAFALCATLLAMSDFVSDTSAAENRSSENPQNEVIGIGNAELAVVLGANPSPAEKRVTELLAGRIKDRAGIALAGPGDKAALRLAIGTVASNDRIKRFSATR